MKRLGIILGLGLLVTVLLIMGRRHPQTTPEETERPDQTTNFPAAITGSETPVASGSNSIATGIVVHTSQEAVAQLLSDFAAVAKLYDFNPTVTNYSRRLPGRGKTEVIIANTPTHIAQIYNGRLSKIQSQIGGSDTRRDPSAEANWYSGPVVWSDQDAIAETMRILQAIGATQTFSAVRDGKKEVMADETRIRQADGSVTRAVPFKTVRLHNQDGVMLVEAEYRMGPTGSAGLSMWFHLGR